MTGGSRRRAREHALQILFALDVNPVPVAAALADHWRLFSDGESDAEVIAYAERLVSGVAERRAEIDAAVQAASKNWRLERMARVDKNLLRVAAYELGHEVDVPVKVIINEAIEIAKRFGGAESAAFVNGLLDRIAAGVQRPAEAP